MTPAVELERPAQPHPMIPRSEAIIPDRRSRQTSQFIFFAGDCCTGSDKYDMPGRLMGGLECDMFLTLKETGKELYARPDLYNTGGFIYRCSITELKTFYYPVNPNMVAPADREIDSGKYIHGYVKENGRRNDKTGQYEDVTVSGQLYLAFYPGDEIEAITRRSNGLRPGGVVRIRALEGKTQQEKFEAQLHYFPNWVDLQTNKAAFPVTLRELREQIVTRMRGTSPDLNSVGLDMLRSCDEFRLWGLTYLKAWRQLVKFAENSIDSPIAGYNDLCEMLFGLLEVNREDTLNQAGNVADIAMQIGQSIAAAIAQGMSPQQAANQVEIIPSADPLEGIIGADPTPGITLASIATGEPPTNDEPPADLEPPLELEEIRVQQKVLLVADGREAIVTWKGPQNKIKVAFADGSTVVVDRSELMAKR